MPESITNSSASAKGNIRRSLLFWTVVILVCMLISFCLDRPMLALVRWLDVESLPGDFERTLQSLKEFGQLFAIVVACLLIFVLDKPRRSMIPRLVILRATSTYSLIVEPDTFTKVFVGSSFISG